MKYDALINDISLAVDEFKKFKQPIRIISHHDSDGITAISIMIAALKRQDIKFVSTIVKQLTPEILSTLSKEKYENFIFLDLGSGSLSTIVETFKTKNIIILDHHTIKENITEKNIIHINPRTYDITEITGAGLAYLFSRELDKNNKDLSYLALIGAIGDIFSDSEFNDQLIKDAIETKKIEIKNGLRMFGTQTKPIYKLLQYCTDKIIPGITGSEEESTNLLNGINIDPIKKLNQLTEDELSRLITAIVIKRASEKNPEDILGPIYILTKEQDESPTKDAKEFSTLLNACGRLSMSSLGIGTCLNDKNLKEKAIDLLLNYKRELINAFEWFNNNKNSKHIIEAKHGVLINAENKIRDTMIGTMASMISKSNIYPSGNIIISLAQSDKNIKISARVSGISDIDLRTVLGTILNSIGITLEGGHKYACGALIPQEKEKEFIENARQILDRNIY